jgi:hypothetical protein
MAQSNDGVEQIFALWSQFGAKIDEEHEGHRIRSWQPRVGLAAWCLG